MSLDADIARAVDERAAAVQRAAEEAEVTRTDDEFDDGQGELTIGQLGVEHGSVVPRGSWSRAQATVCSLLTLWPCPCSPMVKPLGRHVQ